MNPDTFTACGYFESPFGRRLSLSQTQLRHTGDRWEEGEMGQFKPVYTDWNTRPPRPPSEPSDQDILWQHKIWVTLSITDKGFRGYVSPQHFSSDLQQLVSALLRRPVQIAIKLNLPPWMCHPKNRVLTDSQTRERD